MADASDTPKDSSGLAKSFESRLTFPEKTGDKKFNWADEEDDQAAPASDVSKAQTDGAADKENGSVEAAQKDGANAYMGGSGLEEPLGEEFDVNVTLDDLQADVNNPLYSAKSFDDLNLYVNWLGHASSTSANIQQASQAQRGHQAQQLPQAIQDPRARLASPPHEPCEKPHWPVAIRDW